MTSSTSSSKKAEPAGSGYSVVMGIKILVVGFAAMAIAAAATRAFVEIEQSDTESYLHRERTISMMKKAPSAFNKTTSPLVMAFGSSHIQFNFFTDAFDSAYQEATGTKVTSFNFGVSNVQPHIQLQLARRLTESLRESKKHAAFSIVEFNPFQATIARQNSRAFSMYYDQSLSLVVDNEYLLRNLPRAPEHTLRLAAYRYVHDGLSPAGITEYVMETYLGKPDSWPSRPMGEWGKLRKLNGALKLAYAGLADGQSDWFSDLRGTTWRILARGDAEFLRREEAFGSKVDWRNYALKSRVRCCDMLELRFSAGYIRDFVETVKVFQQVSDRVVVILTPEDNTTITRGEDAKERLRQVLDQVRRDTGVRVLDFSGSDQFVFSDFLDVDHMNNLASEKFSNMLANEVATALE